jgi:hypothetical protein
MNSKITEITAMIRRLEDDLELEFARRRLALAFTVTNGKVQFEEYVLQHHKKLRSRFLSYVLDARPLIMLTAPIIYSMIVPIALLDGLASLYQILCFAVYGVPAVRRRDHMVFDRGQLAYLNWLEKFNCFYCSYANGVISYVREIAARTEQYWCPIKHARRVVGVHERYSQFSDYGDAPAYHVELAALRAALAQERAAEMKTADSVK